MPNSLDISDISAQIKSAVAEAFIAGDSDDEDVPNCALVQLIEIINELAKFRANTLGELSAKSQACIDVLAATGGLADAMECTRNLVQSVLEDVARLLPLMASQRD